MDNDLGVLEDVWDVWTPAADIARDRGYFARVAEAQVAEIEHQINLATRGVSGAREAAWAEMVDLIAVALDWMRFTGVTKGEVEGYISDRVKFRYRNNTKKIVEKYNHPYWGLNDVGLIETVLAEEPEF